ncbi:MAG: PilN domain-containing protein [Betaproteobacteria bacterium]
MPLSAWLGWRELAAAALAAAAAAAAWLSLDGAVARESEKVAFLKREIAGLDRDIAEVSSLKDIIAALLARKQIVEAVQAERYTAMALLEQLARQRPQGVYFSALREENAHVFVAGFAASGREVAALLANLNASPLFEQARLVELRQDGAQPVAGYPARFSVSAALKGKRALPRSGAPRFPSDVHPGDPK